MVFFLSFLVFSKTGENTSSIMDWQIAKLAQTEFENEV